MQNFSNRTATAIKKAIESYHSFHAAAGQRDREGVIAAGHVLKANKWIFESVGMPIDAALNLYENELKLSVEDRKFNTVRDQRPNW